MDGTGMRGHRARATSRTGQVEGRLRRRSSGRSSATAAVVPAFTLRWMSVSDRPRDDPRARETIEPGAPGVRPRRVLLVDDDPALRTLYRFNLEVAGVEVIEAADGETALQLLEDALPDVVLLDVMMPGLDGWAVAERLAADPRTRGLAVIFITARAEDEARTRGLGLGAAGYLTKPFNPVFLADEIEKILGRARPDVGPER